MKRFGIALVVVAMLGIVAATWWWALFGMTEDVGWAVIATVGVVGIGGYVIWGVNL